MSTSASHYESSEYGYVYEATATGVTALTNMYFRYASDTDAIDAIAFGTTDDGVEKCTTVISGGLLKYDVTTGYWNCTCPFTAVNSWTLYFWVKADDIGSSLSWESGDTIPVSKIVDRINELRDRARALATTTGRSVKAPEEGTASLFLPSITTRAGRILGFDDDGFPAIGDDVAEIEELREYADTCNGYVEKAAEYAELSKGYAETSKSWSEESSNYADEAEEWSDTAKTYAESVIAYYQKLGTEVEEVLAELTSAIASMESYANTAQTSAATAVSAQEECESCVSECTALVKSLLGTFTIKVLAELPETGEGLIYYFIGSDKTTDEDGNQTGGYYEYIWDWTEEQWICLGSSDYAPLELATTTEAGLVKLSTDTVLTATTAAPIGANAAGQILVPLAERTPNENYVDATNTAGAVFLGSKFRGTNTGSYVVGIGLSNNDNAISFDLEKGGALIYTYEDDETQEDYALQRHYYLKVQDGSLTTKGAVYLCSSLDDYTDDEIDAIRDTHAASVGLVVDGIETYVGEWMDANIQDVFNNWATSDELLEKLVDTTADHYSTWISNIATDLLSKSSFTSLVSSAATTATTSWCTTNLTSTYWHTTFDDTLESLAETYWTDEISSNIDTAVTQAVDEELDSQISSWMSNSTNLATVVSKVEAAISDDVNEYCAEQVIAYMKKIFNGTQTITVNNTSYTWENWIASKLSSAMTSSLATYDTTINALAACVKNYTGTPTTTTLWSADDHSDPDLTAEYIELTVDKDADFLILRTNVAVTSEVHKSSYETDFYPYFAVSVPAILARHYFDNIDEHVPMLCVAFNFLNRGNKDTSHTLRSNNTKFLHVGIKVQGVSSSTMTVWVYQNGVFDTTEYLVQIDQVTFPYAVS